MSLNIEEMLMQLRQQPAKILLVDDEHIVTSSIESYLMLETPHDIVSHNNPLDALAILDTIRPDVVISDFNMPQLTGIEFLKRVKAQFPNVETILLTGYADKENAIAAINEVGIYRYLEKPWDNAQLQATIEQALERQRLVRGLENTLKKVNKLNTTLKNYNVVLEETVAKRTESLEEAKAELEAIFNHSADAIILLDRQGYVELYNPVFEAWVKQAHGEKGSVLKESQVIQWVANLRLEEVRDAFAKGESYYLETRLQGNEMPIEALGTQLPHADGRSLWIFRDVTQRRKLDELRQDFVATLTHDLRTPLQSTLQFYEFFTQGKFGKPTQQQIDMLKVMSESHEDLLSLVNTLLDVYRYESGRQSLVLQEFDIFHVINQVVDALAPLAEERKHLLQLLPCDWSDNRVIFGDVLEIKRVMTNLIGNALKHTPEGTHVEVSAKVQRPGMRPWRGFHEEDLSPPDAWLGWLSLEIKDNGQGIPEEDQAHLFQRFSQGTSRKRNSGSGLGLYLAQQIMHQHGGVITLESHEQKGSVFTLWIPIFEREGFKHDTLEASQQRHRRAVKTGD
ncbi:MAG: ATP-binding protein [Vampirovibrionales bacterium]|jgi:PAS domain S-box-containing protein|nr:ATP-binding protein [Vampirovibrionales bacterium]